MDWDKIDLQDTSVIMHLYRGELHRVNTWRTRMDKTTNWSIVIAVGVLAWTFSSPKTPHWAILPGLILVYVFLFTEARRYMYYDMWRGRVRVLEERFLSKFFDRSIELKEGWTKLLADDLKNPQFKITWQEAVKRRLKRIYIWVISIFVASWFAKIYLHPAPASGWGEFLSRAAGLAGAVPGAVVMAIVLGPITISTLYFLLSVTEREAKGKPKEKKIDEKFGTEEHIEEIKNEVSKQE